MPKRRKERVGKWREKLMRDSTIDSQKMQTAKDGLINSSRKSSLEMFKADAEVAKAQLVLVDAPPEQTAKDAQTSF